MAKLNFNYGAMTCGKSERLISAARNYTFRGLPIVTVMPEIGMRVPGYTTSRSQDKWPIDIGTTESTDLFGAYSRHIGDRAIEAVLVDESQFLTSKQVEALELIAKELDTSVIAYGLLSNVQRRLFEGSKRLIELADRIDKIPTMCSCGSQAEYNGRFVGDGEERVFHVGNPIVWIDTEDSIADYDAMCAGCYLANSASPGAVLL